MNYRLNKDKSENEQKNKENIIKNLEKMNKVKNDKKSKKHNEINLGNQKEKNDLILKEIIENEDENKTKKKY